MYKAVGMISQMLPAQSDALLSEHVKQKTDSCVVRMSRIERILAYLYI